MILDEKCLFPPPPYIQSPSSPSPSDPSQGLTITALPPHLLLHIISWTFPQSDGRFPGESKLQLQRETLHWLHASLRFVNRDIYIACMHVLRSTYLAAYAECVRHPYTSDPFPSSAFSGKGKASTLIPAHRELRTLDIFIALLTLEDRLQDYSSLHLTRDEAYKDIFDLTQPTSRLEDLVGDIGQTCGVVQTLNRPAPTAPSRRQTITSTAPASPSDEKASSESSPYAFLSSIADDSRYTYAIPPSPSQSSLHSRQSSGMSTFSRSSTVGPQPSKRKSLGFFASLFKSKSRPQLQSNPSSSRLSTASSLTITPSSYLPRPKINPLPFSTLSVSFSPRVVKLLYTPPPPTPSRVSSPYSSSAALPYTTGKASSSASSRAKRTLVQVERTRDEALEVTARKIVAGLKEWLEEDASR